MCGQWSEKGYMYNRTENSHLLMALADWKRLVDEVASNDIAFILIRGGEPFLSQGIIELLEYINRKEIYISIGINGTMLNKYTEDIVLICNIFR